MWPNWFHSFRKLNTNKKRKSKRTFNRLRGTEHLEDRSMLATISGYVWDDLNANGIRDTTQISFQGSPPVIVMMLDVSGTSESPFFNTTLPGSNVGDMNGDGTSNSYLDNQIYAYIELNRKLIASGFGQTGRVIIIGYADNAAAVDFARDDFPDPRDFDTFTQIERFVVNPSYDSNNDGVADIEQMLRKFRAGFVPQNGPVGNPVDNTDPPPVPGGFDPNDPLSPNFGSPNFIDVGSDTFILDYTVAHELAVTLLQTEAIVATGSGVSVPALPQFANRVTIMNFATQPFENLDYADPADLLAVPVQRALGVQYYAFGLGAFASLPQLRLIAGQQARILRNFAELDGFVAGSRYTEPGISQVRVYIDANNNARYDAGEQFVTTSADNASTQIDESGNFAFTNLAVGTYIIRQVIPLNFTQTFPTAAFYRVVITAATQTVTNINFSRATNNTFRGFVFNDLNDDGVLNFGERGLANVKVYIDINRNGRRDANEPTAVTIRDIASTTTINEAGQYSFVNVAPGTYIIRAEAPTGFIITSPIPGTSTPLGATVVPGGLAWQITLPARTANGTQINTISGLTFSAVQGPRAPMLTTSSGVSTYTEGQLAQNKHTFVDPRLTIDLRGNAAPGVQLSATILAGADPDDRLTVRNGNGIVFFKVQPFDDDFPLWQIRANGIIVGTAEGGNFGLPLVMTFNVRATQSIIELAARRIEFQNPSSDMTAVDRIVGFEITLPGGQASNLPVKFIRVTTLNNPPVLGPTNPTQITYQAGIDPPVLVFNGVTVTDADNPANFGGGRINVNLGGQSIGPGDLLEIQQTLGLLELVPTAEGNDIYFFDGADWWLIGSVNTFLPGTSMEIQLNSRVTPNIAELLINSIRFSTTTQARPAGATTISLTLTENVALGASNTIVVTIDVQGAPIAALAFALMETQNTKKR